MSEKPTKIPGFPKIPASVDAPTRHVLEAVIEAVEIRLGRRGKSEDRAVTLRELIDSGLAKRLKARPFDPNISGTGSGGSGFGPTTVNGGSTPTSPTGLTVNGTFEAILLFWNFPTYEGHSQTEIWSNNEDVRGDAVLTAVSSSRGYSDPVGSKVSKYYWIRHINKAGIPGPWNATEGTLGTSAEDVDFLLTVLNQSITTSELATDLTTQLDDYTQNISDLQTSIGSVNDSATSAAAAAQSLADALIAQGLAEQAQVNSETAQGLAEGAQASAEEAQVAAATSESNADGYATAALSAQTAAETAQGKAETAESNASSSETNAGTSESNASNYASAAATSYSDLVAFDGDFFFTRGTEAWLRYSGTSQIADVEVKAGGPSATGYVQAKNIWLYSKRRFPVNTAHTYRVRARFKAIDGKSKVYAGVVTYDANGNIQTNSPGTHRYCATVGDTVFQANGWVSFEGLITGEGNNEGHNKFRPGTFFASPVIVIGHEPGTSSTATKTAVDYCIFEDVTEEANAATYASAAADSASTASTKADAASASADAASVSQVAAESAQTAAEGAETNASGYATAASGHADTASTKASDAGTYAQSASDSATTASTKAGDASTYASNASQSATDASGHATAAAASKTAVTARMDDINGDGTNVTVEQKFTAQASSIGDLEGQYTVKIDANGAVAGFGLATTSTDLGDTESEFIVNADRFALMRGGDDDTAAVSPFVVQATATATVPAGVYMDAAFIKNASITKAMIGSVDATSITAGTIDVTNRISAGSLSASKLNLDGVTLKNDGGKLAVDKIKADSIESGTLDASKITVTNLYAENITGDIIRMTPFELGSFSDIGSATYYHTIWEGAFPETQTPRDVYLQGTGWGVFENDDTYEFRVQMKADQNLNTTVTSLGHRVNTYGQFSMMFFDVAGDQTPYIPQSSILKKTNGTEIGYVFFSSYITTTNRTQVWFSYRGSATAANFGSGQKVVVVTGSPTWVTVSQTFNRARYDYHATQFSVTGGYAINSTSEVEVRVQSRVWNARERGAPSTYPSGKDWTGDGVYAFSGILMDLR